MHYIINILSMSIAYAIVEGILLILKNRVNDSKINISNNTIIIKKEENA